MDRYKQLSQSVVNLYSEKRPERADWADWLAENHIVQVTERARVVAERFGGDPELAACGGILHDIADAVMSRFDPHHETTSLDLARQFMEQSGYRTEEIAIVVDDGIALHSCYDGNCPKTPEGRALAAGDALAHLGTDFYPHAKQAMLQEGKSLTEINEWATRKINRDYNDKLIYGELKNEMRPIYESLLESFH